MPQQVKEALAAESQMVRIVKDTVLPGFARQVKKKGLGPQLDSMATSQTWLEDTQDLCQVMTEQLHLRHEHVVEVHDEDCCCKVRVVFLPKKRPALQPILTREGNKWEVHHLNYEVCFYG